jgi:arylsulfatase A-like enzyme
MRLKDHLFVSSYLLAICAIMWGLTEIITVFSSSEFENISYVAYLSVIAFPLLLYGITGLSIGLFIALLLYIFAARKWEGFFLQKGITLYSILYFFPLFLGVEYMWNRRYLPGIPINDPVSLLHSLVVFWIILVMAFLTRGLILLAFRGKLPVMKSLIIGLVLAAGAFAYINLNSTSGELSTGNMQVASHEKPNVILITIDTLRADHLGCYGNENMITPNIDSLSAGGVTFMRATAQVPLTLPSHTSILTSTYPPTHGVRDNAKYQFGDYLPTLADVLKENGYQTTAFISAFVLDSRFGIDKGFEIYDDNIQNQAYFYFSSASPPFALAIGFKLLGLVPPHKPERKAEKTTKAVIDWLEENSGNRFFLWIHYFDPHGPLNPPPPYDTLYLSSETDRGEFLDNVPRYGSLLGQSDSRELTAKEIEGIRALYRGEVTYTDYYIGLLLEQLKKQGVEDKTLLVLTADHGQSISEHDYIGHSMELYRETMHVPLILHCPEMIRSGQAVETPVQSIDIMPTILDLLDIETPETCRGRSLIPLTMAKRAGLEARFSYLETLHPKPGKMKLIGLDSGEYKYIKALEGDREELYWIKNDPIEANNIAATDLERTGIMRKKLQEMLEGMEEYSSSTEIPMDRQTMEAMRALGYIR